MRFEFNDEAGWKSLRKCDNSMQLHGILQANMAALTPVDMTESATHSACFEDARVRQTIHILKCPQASAGGSVVVCESVWELWPAAAGGCLWCHIRTSRESAYYWQQSPIARDVGTTRATLTELHARAPLELVEHGGVQLCMGTERAWSWRVVDVVVRLLTRVCRVTFSSDDSVKSLHLYTTARCVNACYTTCIVGVIDHEHQVKTINTRAERGPCGSELYISSVFGVFQIFPSAFGARRVTCKAFSDVASAEFALEMTCSGLGMSVSGPLLVHMIVMHGNTGRQLDISPRGNLMHCIQRKFSHVAYTEKLDEVNVHALFKWHDVAATCAVCPQALQQRMANKFALLQRVELTVSVTRLGTCIYRVGVKKAPAAQPQAAEPVGFAAPDTADIEQCLFALCAYIHEFITHEA